MKKYQTVLTSLKRRIETQELGAGEKLPSESELIEQFGVSRNSVRQAIGELAKVGLVESRHGIGTFVRKSDTRQTMLIGMVCLRLSSYIFPRIIQGCNRILQKNRYDLLLQESWYDLREERRALMGFQERGVDGIILIPVNGADNENNSEIVHRIESDGTAIVLLDNEYLSYEFSSVLLDDQAAGYTAAEHLWELGHREIGVLFSSNYRPKVMRKEGVTKFLREAGASINDDYIIGIDGQVSPFHTYGQIRRLFSGTTRLPTGVVCSSDDEALMFIHQARKHGFRIPQDISVVSFDNSDVSKVTQPRLTTIDHPSEYMGEIAATHLIDRIRRREAIGPTRTTIRSDLIRRDSAIPPNR